MTQRCYLCSCGIGEICICPDDMAPSKVAAIAARHKGHGVLIEVTPEIHAPYRVLNGRRSEAPQSPVKPLPNPSFSKGPSADPARRKSK